MADGQRPFVEARITPDCEGRAGRGLIKQQLQRRTIARGARGGGGQRARDPCPGYGVFLADTTLELKNLSNHLTEGTAVASLRGRFMGSGATVATATFRPEKGGPDLTLAVKIDSTQANAM